MWLNEAGAARGEAQLAELRFEVEGLQRLLEASKTERDFLVRRYEVELDAARAAADADLRAMRDAARWGDRKLHFSFRLTHGLKGVWF